MGEKRGRNTDAKNTGLRNSASSPDGVIGTGIHSLNWKKTRSVYENSFQDFNVKLEYGESMVNPGGLQRALTVPTDCGW